MTLKQKALAVISVLNNETNYAARRVKMFMLAVDWDMPSEDVFDLIRAIEVARDTAHKWDKWE